MSHINTHDIRSTTKHIMTFMYGSTGSVCNKRAVQRHNRLMSRIHGANATMYRLTPTPVSGPVTKTIWRP